MPRPRTGNVYESRGKWYARVWLGRGTRPSFLLASVGRSEAEARLGVLRTAAEDLTTVEPDVRMKLLGAVAGAKNAAELREALALIARIASGKVRVATTGPRPLGAGETVRSIGVRWTNGELARLYPDHVREKRAASHDVSRLERYVYPLVGDVEIATLTLDHAETVMRALPPDLRPATRRQVAQLLSRILALAVFPLRLRESSPLPRGWLPRIGAQPRGELLFPDEEAALLRCASVPFEVRLLVGFLAREGMRASEAALLTWANVDLVHGTVHLDANKTDDPRAWALSPDVVRVLSHLHEKRKPKSKDLVFLDAEGTPFGRVYQGTARLMYGAEQLRSHLREAGVDRDRLFTAGPAHEPTRLHDLRGLFVTSALATGRSEAWVSERTGHKSSVMIERYRRRASTWQQAKQGALVPLDEGLGLDPPPVRSGGGSGGTAVDPDPSGTDKARRSGGFRRVESNHDSGIQSPLSCL